MADSEKPKKKSKAIAAKPEENASPPRKTTDKNPATKTTLFTWLRRYVDFKNLDSFIDEEKSSESIKDSFLIITVAQMVSILTILIATLVSLLLFQGSPLPSLLQLLAGLIIGIAVFYLVVWFVHSISKALGGTSKIAPLARFMSIITLCSIIISAPAVFILLVGSATSVISIAILEMLAFIIWVLLWLYQLFVLYKTIRQIHSLSMYRALGVIGALVVLYIVGFLLILFG